MIALRVLAECKSEQVKSIAYEDVGVPTGNTVLLWFPWLRLIFDFTNIQQHTRDCIVQHIGCDEVCLLPQFSS